MVGRNSLLELAVAQESLGGSSQVSIQKIIKLLSILPDPAFVRALLKGAAAGIEHRKLLQSLDCRHVVDIGANCGQFALISRKCFPDARIDSFEPLVEPADRFERVFSGDINTHLHRCAIGAEKATRFIHVSERDDSSSLLPIGKNQSELFPHTGEREVREVTVLPLHEVIDAKNLIFPSLLKIDVQGFELEVLKGPQSKQIFFFPKIPGDCRPCAY
jgi:FkbM family methyltransferase